MKAAKVILAIARLPDCAGQAADAVSAYIHVKMEDTSKLLIIPESKCLLICGYVCHDTNDPNSLSNVADPVVLCADTHMQASCGKDSLRKFCWD